MKRLNYHPEKQIEPVGLNRKAYFVYVIRCEQFVKIGIAGDPKARMKELQVGNPFKLHLIACFWSENAAKDEGQLHKLLDAHHHRGEWFTLSEAFENLLKTYQPRA